jgi:hypothetical protein
MRVDISVRNSKRHDPDWRGAMFSAFRTPIAPAAIRDKRRAFASRDDEAGVGKLALMYERLLPIALLAVSSAACEVKASTTSAASAITHVTAGEVTSTKLACQRLASPAARAELKIPADAVMPAGCMAHPGGGWAILQRPAGDKINVHVKIVHVTDDGALVQINLQDNPWQIRTSPTEVDALSEHVPRIRLVYDFDHDGVGEVWLHTAEETWGVQADTLLTVKDGNIVPYAPTKDMTPFILRDIDKDGIPDLAFRFMTEGGGDVCGAPDAAVYSLPMLGHAKADGTFVYNDTLAQKNAHDACPVKPTKAAKDMKGQDVICARAWGVPASAFAHFEHDAKVCQASTLKMKWDADPRPCEKSAACSTMGAYAKLAKAMPDVGLK